ncbi:hypothetical protein MF672_012150 [Actinomadura sp. ATCC 31491]|uniref:Uncharacterized protein n=1 Tax=Actinomadura luzonensis TaxID=2805427 RepID=A0ABT0FQF0_9ACTN|nr:hypothetical protein [Actinomadura luzonensis]MCK2214536.1 hypothetical protein [Actinomadura luzonensis]
MSEVLIPGDAVDEKGRDVAAPAADLMQALNLQSEGQPAGYDLIKADALSLTKWITSLIGGGSVTVGGLGTALLSGTTEVAERVALIAGLALLLSAAAVSVAWVVITDVRTRADVQKARIEARTALGHDYLGLVDRFQPPPIVLVPDGHDQ